MDNPNGILVVNASDLVGHLACGHLTELNLNVLANSRPAPLRADPDLDLLQQRGLAHEAAYLARLHAEGKAVVEITEPTQNPDYLAALRERQAATVAAMRDGTDVVFQGTFLDDTTTVAWRGHVDFLRRVEQPSDFGAFGYEPEDTKLARHVKPSAVLQLCHYAEQVERIQGVAAQHIHVVLGGQNRETIRLADVAAYYRAARERFLRALAEARVTYPLPVSHCDVCRWIEVCEKRWHTDDHLSGVAGLRNEQARRLEAAGITTGAALAASPVGLRIAGIGVGTLARLQQQARLQAARVEGQPPPVELARPLEPARGLALLPTPNPGDLYYDIEGDPFVGHGGIEYLHGIASIHNDALAFQPFWGHDPAGERHAFEQLVDFIVERRRLSPNLHVYHYAAYEITALRKLMGRYGTREAEVDDLLRGNVFVDLYRVVRQGLVIGSSSYSLKKLEPLYMPARTGAITNAGSSIVEYERWLQTGDQDILDNIEAYNRDDVESTWLLHRWLEARRAQAVADGDTLDHLEIQEQHQPDDAGDPRARDAEATTADLIDQLLDGNADPPSRGTAATAVTTDVTAADRAARGLMAHLLRWHQREAKPAWWNYFDRVQYSDDVDLRADTEAIAGLTVVGSPQRDGQSFIWTYEFDADQEHKLDVGSAVLDPEVERQNMNSDVRVPGPGRLVALDSVAGVLRLRRGVGSIAPHPRALIPGKPISTNEQRASLQRVAVELLNHGVHGPGPVAAGRRLLGGLAPRIERQPPAQALRAVGESAGDAAVRLVAGLEQSHLPIQGPPGAGKTFTAAQAVVALVAAGRRVGITAHSHSVISHLLDRVMDEAAEQGIKVRAMQRTAKGAIRSTRDGVIPAFQNNVVEQALAAETLDVVAGTGWLFARQAMADSLHTLVVDEAGQLSLANVIAVAPAAENLVLVGDPCQLAQPSQGVHPLGAEASGLDHLLAGEATIPEHLGLFLDRTWRLHPGICHFISEQFYDQRLAPKDHCANRSVDDGPVVGGTGLRWAPVVHEGNRVSAPDEAGAVARIVGELLGRPWTDEYGTRQPLTLADILVVAPYNAQVRLLSHTLPPGARVGTVDRFQGQEAAVVVVSLTASSAQAVPRGMEFLYSRHRINVAVSRAQALCIMVGSPALLAAPCRSLEQMRLVNALCRYVELAEEISLPPAPM